MRTLKLFPNLSKLVTLSFIPTYKYIQENITNQASITMQRKEFTQENKTIALSQALKGNVDLFNSIHLDGPQLDAFLEDKNQFKIIMDSCLQQWRQNNVKAIWLTLSINQINLVDVAIQCGFEMHHCTKDHIVLSQWLLEGETSRLPHYTSHFIGAGGLIINDKNEMLVVQEKNGHREGSWGIPGGLVDDGELITEAAEREVKEETGLDAVAYDMLLFREVMDSKFNKADLYFVILLRLKDQQQQITLCSKELSNYKWLKMDELDQFIKNHKCGPTSVNLMNYLLDLQKKKVDLSKAMFSMRKGEREFYGEKKKFCIYSPHL